MVGSFQALISQEIFTINDIEIFRTIAEWYLLLFVKFRSYRVKNEKVYDGKFVTAKCSSINYGATLKQ